MTLNFQKNLLTYLLTDKDAKTIIKEFHYDCFELVEHQIICQLLQRYYGKYKIQPSRVNLVEFMETNLTKYRINDETKEVISNELIRLYVSLPADVQIYKDEAILFIQRRKLKKLLIDNLDNLKGAKDTFFNEMIVKLKKINDLSLMNVQKDDSKQKWFIKGNSVERRTHTDSFPTYLRRLNSFTASGGFNTPELVVFMGAPKSFKTGLLLNICVNYVLDGLKVFYVDFENGAENLKIRAQQCLSESTYKEIASGQIDKILTQQMKRASVFGGEMVFHSFNANIDTIDDVDNELERLKVEENFEPDLIAYDYADLAECADKTIKEKRLKIQHIYHHIIRINNKRKTFAITLSQVKQTAVNKKIIDLTDFGEDFGKAQNCHAAFAICRTKEEQEQGVGRIVIVAQRMGEKPSNRLFVPIQFDEAKMQVKEIEYIREEIEEEDN